MLSPIFIENAPVFCKRYGVYCIVVFCFLCSTCKHGNWICNYNLTCLKDSAYKGYECTGYTTLHDRILCKEGYKCKFTKISEGTFPSLGFCEPLDLGESGVFEELQYIII